MKTLIGSMLILAACSGHSEPAEAHQESMDLVGKSVTVVMESGNSVVSCTLVKLNELGILCRLNNNKLYFYPKSRLFVIVEN